MQPCGYAARIDILEENRELRLTIEDLKLTATNDTTTMSILETDVTNLREGDQLSNYSRLPIASTADNKNSRRQEELMTRTTARTIARTFSLQI
jgi:hypothetical protein